MIIKAFANEVVSPTCVIAESSSPPAPPFGCWRGREQSILRRGYVYTARRHGAIPEFHLSCNKYLHKHPPTALSYLGVGVRPYRGSGPVSGSESRRGGRRGAKGEGRGVGAGRVAVYKRRHGGARGSSLSLRTLTATVSRRHRRYHTSATATTTEISTTRREADSGAAMRLSGAPVDTPAAFRIKVGHGEGPRVASLARCSYLLARLLCNGHGCEGFRAPQ